MNFSLQRVFGSPLLGQFFGQFLGQWLLHPWLLRQWRGLSARDQRALRLGAVTALALSLMATLVWRLEAHQTQSERIAIKESQLLALQQTGARVGAAPRPVTDPRAMERELIQALQTVGVPTAPTAMPTGGWEIEVSNAPLAQIIELERKLSTRGVPIFRYRLQPGSDIGRVDARLEWRPQPP